MKKNQYWAIKHNRWDILDSYNICHTRKGVITKYLAFYSGTKYADKPWAWHKKHNGVSVVKVQITEIEK